MFVPTLIELHTSSPTPPSLTPVVPLTLPPPTQVTLELGGKSPAVVFADCDLAAAVEATTFGLFFNAGQCCCASSRIFVQEEIYEEFVRAAGARAAKITVGAGLSSGKDQGVRRAFSPSMLTFSSTPHFSTSPLAQFLASSGPGLCGQD